MSDLYDKVVLTKPYRDRRGNLYPASMHEKFRYELPEPIRYDPYYVSVKEEVRFMKQNQDTVDRINYGLSASNDDKDGRLQNEFKADIGVLKTTQELKDTVNVNEADIKALVALPGVGEALARRVITQRQKSYFTSIEDIEKRVPLPFGRSWSELNVSVNPSS